MEYAILIACIAAALLTMQIYIKRSIQGRIRGAADEIGEQYSAKTSTSSLTQTITTADKEGNTQIISKGTPRFIDVEVTDETGATHIEKREIMEMERSEPVTLSIGKGSYEETGSLSDEKLFD
ncbi:MAG: hypothetical protein WC301_05780 [Candidatus Omnitrophota bacterium]